MAKPSSVSPSITLAAAHRFIAELVAAGGQVYLPIFERLEEELQHQSMQHRLLDKARLIAAQKNPTLASQTAFCAKLGPAP